MSTAILERPARPRLGEQVKQGNVAASDGDYSLVAQRQELVGDYVFSMRSYARGDDAKSISELVFCSASENVNRTIARRRS